MVGAFASGHALPSFLSGRRVDDRYRFASRRMSSRRRRAHLRTRWRRRRRRRARPRRVGRRCRRARRAVDRRPMRDQRPQSLRRVHELQPHPRLRGVSGGPRMRPHCADLSPRPLRGLPARHRDFRRRRRAGLSGRHGMLGLGLPMPSALFRHRHVPRRPPLRRCLRRMRRLLEQRRMRRRRVLHGHARLCRMHNERYVPSRPPPMPSCRGNVRGMPFERRLWSHRPHLRPDDVHVPARLLVGRAVPRTALRRRIRSLRGPTAARGRRVDRRWLNRSTTAELPTRGLASGCSSTSGPGALSMPATLRHALEQDAACR